MKKLISVLGMMAIVLGISACNTMKGFGQDVQRGGEKVEGAADHSGGASSSDKDNTNK